MSPVWKKGNSPRWSTAAKNENDIFISDDSPNKNPLLGHDEGSIGGSSPYRNFKINTVIPGQDSSKTKQ